MIYIIQFIMITLISEFHCIFHFERNGTRIISDGIWFEIKCKNGMKIQKKISLLHSCLFFLFIKIVLFFEIIFSQTDLCKLHYSKQICILLENSFNSHRITIAKNIIIYVYICDRQNILPIIISDFTYFDVVSTIYLVYRHFRTSSLRYI